MTSNLETLIRRAAEVENTPELQKYWERRYQEAQGKNRFQLNQKTVELIESKEPISKPATTYADLILLSHLNNSQELQENLLQDTIETVVRLLDALLDIVDFTPEASRIIGQYRKIAVGVGDLEEYLKQTQKPESESIEFLGNFISSKAYRASESLAEEKGACQAWSKINQHLRPKAFEFWYNRDSGEIRSGQELSKEFDQESILTSDFEIIPRRNSSLLLYPQTEPWRTWSDRDQTAPQTPISPSQTKTQEDVPPKIHTENPKPTEPMFQLGELVQIQEPTHPKHQAILQVVEVETTEGETQYRLSDGQKETENELWPETSLAVVELSELLDILNQTQKSTPSSQSESVEVWVRALVLNETEQVLVQESQQGLDLPGIILPENQVPEKILQKYLVDSYQFAGEITEEVGSALGSDQPDNQTSSLHLGFAASFDQLGTDIQTQWLQTNSTKLPNYARVLLAKWRQRRGKLTDLEKRLELAIAEQRRIEEILQSEPDKQKAAAKYTSKTSHREYKPEVLAKTLGSLSKYVLKLEQMVQSKTYGEMLLTLTYDAYGPRIVNLEGKDLPFELKQTLELFLDLINFILTNNINPHFLSEKLEFKDRESIQLPIKQLLQFIGNSLSLAPERVQEIDSALIEEIDNQNLNKIKKRDTLKSDLENSK